jgi:hypothetical protein
MIIRVRTPKQFYSDSELELLKTVFGLLPAWKGQMALDGKGLASPTPRELLGLYQVAIHGVKKI